MPNFQSAPPARFIAGLTQNMPFQPLAAMGTEDPFFYAMDADDFLPYVSGNYTPGGTGGTVAAAAGPGGLITGTIPATLNDSVTLERTTAGFAIQSTNSLFWCGRFMLSQITSATFQAGLFAGTPLAPTDGLYFSSVNGSLVFNSLVGSANTGSVTLTSIFAPTAATTFDLAFAYRPYSDLGANVELFAGVGLFGNKSGAQNSTPLGPIGRLIPTSFTTANLALGFGAQTTAATALTVTADFHMAALER